MAVTAFASSTPAAVRDVIENFLANLIDPSSRLHIAVGRLAANEEMESLWRKLPRNLSGREAEIIMQTIIAYERAASLRPPHEKQMKLMIEFLEKHAPITDPVIMAEYKQRFVTPLTYSSIAVTARLLLDDLAQLSNYARANWRDVWPGDPDIAFDNLLGIVDAIAVCCDRLNSEARLIEAAMKFPEPPRKRGSATAQRVYFTQIMDDYFRREFDQPMTEILAVLEQMMFDLPDAVGESTVRKRRQRTGRLAAK